MDTETSAAAPLASISAFLVAIGSSAAMADAAENATGAERKCDFRSGKIILQRPIEPEQMQKLLTTGKTDLLHRFISKKGRPFSAYLTRGDGGKVTFEFAPREPKAAKAKAPVKATAKAPAPSAKAPAHAIR